MKNIHIHSLNRLLVVMAICTAATSYASETAADAMVEYTSQPIVRKDAVPDRHANADDLVIVNGDTISRIIPQKNYGRYDRGLFNYLYIPKGKWAFGLTASYGSLKTQDIEVLSVLDNLDFNGSIYSIKPSAAYFINHNQSVGVRLTYNRGKADLQNMSLDVAEDMNFNLHDVSYHSSSFRCGLFYRYYVGLNRENRFAVFNEVSLDYGTGTSHFKRYYDDVLYNTRTVSTLAGLNFSPGLCVFIQQNLAFNISFGVFGLKYEHDKQETNGVDEGSRTSSGANFRFNIFNINFGLQLVI